MKIIIVTVLLTFFSTAYGVNNTALVIEFSECALRAAKHGIEGLVPSHNPLHLRDIDITKEFLGVGLSLQVTSNELSGILDKEYRKVDVSTFADPDTLSIDYDLYWRWLNFTGDYAYNVTAFGLEFAGSGTYKIVLDHTHFLGVFNLTETKNEEDDTNELEVSGFTLDITVTETEAYIPEANTLTNNLIKDAFFFIMNHVPSALGDFIRVKRFNAVWLANHFERVIKLTEWCAANPA